MELQAYSLASVDRQRRWDSIGYDRLFELANEVLSCSNAFSCSSPQVLEMTIGASSLIVLSGSPLLAACNVEFKGETSFAYAWIAFCTQSDVHNSRCSSFSLVGLFTLNIASRLRRAYRVWSSANICPQKWALI